MTNWVRTYDDQAHSSFVESLDGMDWPGPVRPGWFHLCSPQTRGFDGLDLAERCACGGERVNRGRWTRRNQTRRMRLLASLRPQPRGGAHARRT
jgi:hypothetical protein